MRSVRALILGPLVALGLGVAGLTATAAAQSAPTCVPTSLDVSALQAGAVTVSPLAGSRDASPQTQISFLGAAVGNLTVQSVTGSRSGAHGGRLEAYSQGDGASFVPGHPFVEGERVTVHARVRVGSSWRPILDVFGVAHPDPISSTPEKIHAGSPSDEQSFHSRSDLHPPKVTVTASSPAASPGQVLLAPYGGPGQAGPMILDSSGGLVWFKALPRYTSATNLKVQEYEGKPVLTWWQGDINVHGFGTGEDVLAGSDYEVIAHVRAGNGHRADLHEFQLTPQGTALVTSYFPVLCNLSSVGAPSYAGLTDGVFQEIDVKTGLVMFEWTSLDHVAIGESYESTRHASTQFPYDFFHINSLNLDRDGSLLISARNTWAAYELDPSSGQIRWRLGGKHSSFKGAASTRTAWQHDPRELPDGSISIFDNGSAPTVHQQSRGIVVRVDPQNGTVALVGQLTHSPALIAESEGNVQALANGDWFLGWGQEPFVSELNPAGQLLFAAHLPVHERSYRSFRMPWTGAPVHVPALSFEPAGARAGTVYASWNGATQVASWQVLAGGSAQALRPIVTATRTGFETAIALPGGTTGPYLAVQALDGEGNVLRASAAVKEPTLE